MRQTEPTARAAGAAAGQACRRAPLAVVTLLQRASVGVGALDRPDGGNVSDPRSLRDLHAVHEPDCHIAAAVPPEKVALAVAVEVPGADDRPHVGYSSDPRSPR